MTERTELEMLKYNIYCLWLKLLFQSCTQLRIQAKLRLTVQPSESLTPLILHYELGGRDFQGVESCSHPRRRLPDKGEAYDVFGTGEEEVTSTSMGGMFQQ